MTGSVLVPVKALVLNLLSLTATFGAMVWIFQDGHLSGLLDFTANRHHRHHHADPACSASPSGCRWTTRCSCSPGSRRSTTAPATTSPSVAVGLERTGRIVTAAAVLLAIVFVAFATSQVSFIKLFGIGLALAVLVDATLIRAALVPGVHAPGRPGQLVGAGAAAPPPRPVRHCARPPASRGGA